ncbi:MAG: hypothetical protein R3344_07750, partial [Acidobacteriota bacterium]|nr:hypothetical protein [Acidobacteriota bacterium]
MTQVELIVIACGAVVLVGVAAFLLGRMKTRVYRGEAERWRSEHSRVEAQHREQTRAFARLRNEQRSVSNLARSLPYVVSELNRVDLDPRSVPGLMIQLAEAVFEPDQVLVYMAESPQSADGPREIVLREHRG